MHWRVVSQALPNGQVLTVGEDLSNVEKSAGRLLLINVLVGVGVLGTLVIVGAFVVRRSLRSLVEIEQTAAAIAGGDLTRRVPDLGTGTELGQLSAGRSTRCWPRSRRRSPPAPRPNSGRSARRSGCASSSRTPPTSCVRR